MKSDLQCFEHWCQLSTLNISPKLQILRGKKKLCGDNEFIKKRVCLRSLIGKNLKAAENRAICTTLVYSSS